MEAKNLNSEQTLANDPVANSYWFLTEDKNYCRRDNFYNSSKCNNCS